ncbi:MAG: hypothetical protein V3T83_08630 [Acidobacteriota bacterium]
MANTAKRREIQIELKALREAAQNPNFEINSKSVGRFNRLVDEVSSEYEVDAGPLALQDDCDLTDFIVNIEKLKDLTMGTFESLAW